MSDDITDVGPDSYPFYSNEASTAVADKKEGYGFDSNTSNRFIAVPAVKIGPNKLITTNRLGRYPYSAIPVVPVAITNRAGTVIHKIFVETDGALSYDILTAIPATTTVTNRAVTQKYRLYIEDDGVISYDAVSYFFSGVIITNRAGNAYYRLYVEDDGAISYDTL